MDAQTATTTIAITQPKAHKGLLRGDLLLLRHTFGLHFGRSQEGLDQNRGQNLPGSKIKDLLIVSLDIEGHPNQFTEHYLQYQVGLSILDTRHLQPSISDTQHGTVLETYHFCVGPDKYFKKRKSQKFCFGQSRHVTIGDLQSEIQKLISERDVILVVHGGKDDLLFLKAVEIDLRPLYIVDTQKAAQNPLQLDYRCKIERLLELLECPFDPDMLHNAGNDANFTLRALLLIATIDATKHSILEPGCRDLLSAFEKIAKEHVPLEVFRKIVAEFCKREHNRAQNRRHRKNVRLKEARQIKNKKLDLKIPSAHHKESR